MRLDRKIFTDNAVCCQYNVEKTRHKPYAWNGQRTGTVDLTACITGRSGVMGISLSKLCNKVTKSHVWLLSPWNVASVIEEQIFNF